MKVGTFTAFDVETVSHGPDVERRLAGELDIGAAGHFRQAFAALEHRAGTIVVDLSALTFVDSTGLHELVVAHKRQQASGGELVLQAPSALTRRARDRRARPPVPGQVTVCR